MKFYYFLAFLGISAISTFTMHAQDVQVVKGKKIPTALVLVFATKNVHHPLVVAERRSHNSDLVLARSKRAPTSSQKSSPSSSTTSSPQESPSISPREEEGKKKPEIAGRQQPKQQVHVAWQ